jgi:hypothetical protein
MIHADLAPLFPHQRHLLIHFLDLELRFLMVSVKIRQFDNVSATRIDATFDRFVFRIRPHPAVDMLAILLVILSEIRFAIRKALLVVLFEISFDLAWRLSFALNPPDVGTRHACFRAGVSGRVVAVFTPSTGVVVGEAELSRLVDALNHAGGWSVSMARDNAFARFPTCLAHFESSISTAASA